MSFQSIDWGKAPNVLAAMNLFSRRFPYFKSLIPRQFEEFGMAWLNAFELELSKFFPNNLSALESAAEGYGRFSLDGMRLQKLFDKTHCYENKTYAEAAQDVYQNKDYMFSLYLPGILLSHYLWRHHYLQHIFFVEKFLPLVRAHGGKRFYDIGVGTGFYSKEMLVNLPEVVGEGFDLSPYSLEHTVDMLSKWDVADRYHPNLRNVVTDTPAKPASFLVNIEVLEHLEDPQEFLNALFQMLEPGGYGLISAAITAPNADHIYLYNSADEVILQLAAAGFELVDYIEDAAYVPRKPTDTVPRNAAFIVTRK